MCIWDGLVNSLEFNTEATSGAVSVQEKHFSWPFGCGEEGADCLVLDMCFLKPPPEYDMDCRGQSHVAVLYVDASETNCPQGHLQCCLFDFSDVTIKAGTVVKLCKDTLHTHTSCFTILYDACF